MYMTSAARLLVLAAIVFTGCTRTRQAARDVAVTTFRVIDAPANYVRRKLDAEEGETIETEEVPAGSSDVVTPGRPVEPRRTVVTGPQRGPGSPVAGNPQRGPGSNVPGPTPRPRRETAAPTITPPPATDFPTARPVPGKPGFVYSIAPDGGIVDVTGYKSGDKAKDPYTKQIFIVP